MANGLSARQSYEVYALARMTESTIMAWRAGLIGWFGNVATLK